VKVNKLEGEIFMFFIKKNKTSTSEEVVLRKKSINQTMLILYISMMLVSIIIWFLLYKTIEEIDRVNLWTAILTTILTNGFVGLIGTLVLNKEKDKVLDASIERVRNIFLDEHFVAETIPDSLKRGFEYCNNRVEKFRVYAVSTSQIFPFVESINDIHIDNCYLMVRGYGENMSKDEIESDNEIKLNIKRWESLKPECVKKLEYIRYNNYSLNYYCIFDNKFITFGQYLVDEERKNMHSVDFLLPFSITNETKVGRQIINNYIKQFDSYFNSEKKKHINFNEFASRYDSLRKADEELIFFLIKKCGIEKKSKILDFGCGTGNYIEGFRTQGFNNIFGLDTSEEMRKIASGKTHKTIYKQFSDVNEHFHIIFIIDVIHFIKDINSLARELYSKCVDEAIVAIVTQSHSQIENRRYRKFFPSAIEMDLKRYHKIDTLIKEFESVGFSLKENTIFKGNTTRKLDFAFLNKVKNKCFSMFELIDEEEFYSGIKKFEEALASANNNVIEESYAGKTILLFSKTKTIVSTPKNNNTSGIVSGFRKFFV